MVPIPVFRVIKTHNYTTMSNYHLRDMALTLKAKGLLSQILSLPEDWDYSVRGLTAICKEGRDCLMTVLRELEGCGYLERHRQRLPDGTLGGMEYVIYEQPRGRQPESGNPALENPALDKPALGNPPQLSTDSNQNTELTNNGEDKEPRRRYGRYQNVLFSDGDMEKLQAEFPVEWQTRIERLSEYMASTGKTYKSHLATIRSWARRDAAESKKKKGYRHENYQYEEGESL